MISIIIATKNGEKYLHRSIGSIESQTEKDFEVIVVSDGSTDNTPVFVKEMMSDRPWLKLIDLSQNIGPGKARDMGIKEAQGEYIAFLDDDDQWLDPDKLSTQKNFLDQNPEYVLVGAKEIMEINEKTGRHSPYEYPASDSDIRKECLKRNCFATSSIMFRKQTYLSSGGFGELRVAEDYDLNLKMGRLGKMANLDRCLTGYTIRPGGASKTGKLDLYKNIIKIVRANRSYYPGYWMGIIKACARLVYFYIK